MVVIGRVIELPLNRSNLGGQGQPQDATGVFHVNTIAVLRCRTKGGDRTFRFG